MGRYRAADLIFDKLKNAKRQKTASELDRTIQSICDEKFKDFEHGLTIINRNTGQTVFKLGKLAIENPDKELSKWVVRSIECVKESS